MRHYLVRFRLLILAAALLIQPGLATADGVSLLNVDSGGGLSRAATSVRNTATRVARTVRADAKKLKKIITSKDFVKELTLDIAKEVLANAVPGGELASLLADVALDVGVDAARHRDVHLDEASAGALGGMVGGALLAEIPGGVILGGVAGERIAKKLYQVIKEKTLKNPKVMAQIAALKKKAASAHN